MPLKRAALSLTETKSETGGRPKHKAKDFWRLWGIVNDAAGRLDIYETIGEYAGISAKSFVGELTALGDVDEIDLFINSDGGDVFDSFAIYAALQRHPAVKNVYIDGLAASAASFIAMAGDSISISASARMMIHAASAVVVGDAIEMRKVADILESLTGTIASIYSKRSGGRQQTFLNLMAAETWFDAEQAVKAGLADKITDMKGKPARNSVAARLREIASDERRYGQYNSRPSDAAIAARLREIASH
jgi:ATP-dependent protease ClpP protease subunit